MGLILCLIYVNDLPLSPTETSADIFADDTTISAVSHSNEDLIQSLTNYLHFFLYWCNSNNMSLIVSKTKLMYMSSRHKQISMTKDETSINLCDSKILPTSVEKLLGVTIDNSLCWDNHINQVLKM